MKTKTWQERFDKEFPEFKKYTEDENDEYNGEIENFISNLVAQTKEETLKELIREYQDNELDGKGYDFYFSIRAKIDELNKLKK